MSLAGHYWTVAPRLGPMPPSPPASPWETEVEDPAIGPVRLTGMLSEAPGAREAVLLVHGISGTCESRYARVGAAEALAAGLSCLRLNLRGSDRRGEDYYHAGLWTDLAAALESPQMVGYERLFVLGYSLGGHLALRIAAEEVPRLAAVAAICTPLDLAAGQRAIDRPAGALYRLYVLRGLRQLYNAVAERRPVPVTPAQARRIRTMYEWDERIVAPRWGFAGADDYYARESAANALPYLRVPSLLLAAEDDPMIPADTLRPVLEEVAAPRLTVRWLAGAGHLGFPNGMKLHLVDGEQPGRKGRTAAARRRVDRPDRARAHWSDAHDAGLDAQIFSWLRAAAGSL
jgi:hypothetical protein